jgi:hypothetical protein
VLTVAAVLAAWFAVSFAVCIPVGMMLSRRNGDQAVTVAVPASALAAGDIIRIDACDTERAGIRVTRVTRVTRTGVNERWLRIETPIGTACVHPDTVVAVIAADTTPETCAPLASTRASGVDGLWSVPRP